MEGIRINYDQVVDGALESTVIRIPDVHDKALIPYAGDIANLGILGVTHNARMNLVRTQIVGGVVGPHDRAADVG